MHIKEKSKILNTIFKEPKERKEFFISLFKTKNDWRNVLYIHTPFCKQKCKYCVYNSTDSFTEKEFNDFYNNIIPNQIKEYEEVFENVEFDEVYFGGGTPTIADAGTLEALFSRIPNFDQIPIKSIEASPTTITKEHIDLFVKRDFSYVSLGVQSLSKRILDKQNRLFASRHKLKQICEQFEKTNIIYNFDLICFLDKGDIEDIPQFRADLEYVITKLRPISITIHSNYKAISSEAKTEQLIRLIKDMISKYPEYKCVNSCLSMNDVREDTKHSAEYKLMRKSFDFFHYMWQKYPTMPIYGTNILSLGYRESEITMSSFGKYLMKGGIFELSICEGYEFPIENFIHVRKSLNLPY
jgi:coproporphyrinogen III oxidase-like Fe-S oxidoreductase